MSRFYDPKTQKRVDKIPKKSGKGDKSPTIRDAKELGFVPSVTTVTDLISKPFLLQWLQTQAFDSAWESAHTPMPKDEAWSYYQKTSAQARDKGTLLHDRMSRLESCPETKPALAWIESRNYLRTMHEIEFATNRFGGTIDFLGVIEEPVDPLDVPLVDLIDFKFVTSDRKPYDTELWQISAYRQSLFMRNAARVRNAYNLYISQSTGEILNEHCWTFGDHQRGFTTFCRILDTWAAINNWNQ